MSVKYLFIKLSETKIKISPSINPFFNVIVLVEFVNNLNFEIFVGIHFLQVAIVIYKISVSVLLGFDNHNFCFVSIDCHTHGRAKILKNS